MTIQEKTTTRSSSPTCPVKTARAETCSQNPESAVEILIEGQECPYCQFAELKKDGNEIVCPICGYGRKPST